MSGSVKELQSEIIYCSYRSK